MNLLLDVDGVTLRYGSRRRQLTAVDNVSFSVDRAEILGIVGQSGSGKSTLGRAIAGFMHPDEGAIRIAGADGEIDAPQQRRGLVGRPGVQMIFQDSRTSLDPRWPIWRSVAEALGTRRGQISKYTQALRELQRVEIDEELALKKPANLSGGQRQRAAIARALASKARLIVCDEAVAALDVSVRAGVLNLLLDIRQESGTAFVFISHDMSVVAHLSDRVAVMHAGAIEEIGETDQVIRAPRAEYTKRLIAAVPAFEKGGLA